MFEDEVGPVRAVSPSEFSAHRERTLAEPEEIRPGIWTVPLRMPQGVAPTSFAYLIVDHLGRGHLIDAGWDSPDNRGRLDRVCTLAGITTNDIDTVVSTHLHADHLGAAADLRLGSGASIILHRIEQNDLSALREWGHEHGVERLSRWGVPEGEFEKIVKFAQMPPHLPSARADRLVEHGDVIELGNHRLHVIHTPGHTRGHICLAMPEQGLLFTGDHVLPTIVPGLGLGLRDDDNPLDEYLSTVTSLKQYDHLEVCPGHGYRFVGLGSRLNEIVKRHQRRANEVTDVIRENPAASVWEVAERVTWTAGWSKLHTFLLLSALSQIEMILGSKFRSNLR